MVYYTQIVAISENYVIADENGIPWKIKEDLKHYKETVKDSIVISGRVTFERITDYEGREHIVLSRNEDWEYDSDSVHHAIDVEEAMEIASALGSEDECVYVIGGENVYREFLDIADEMVISHINGEYEGTRYFPKFDEVNWDIVDVDDSYDEFTIKRYHRK